MNNKILKIGLLIVAMCFVIGCSDNNKPLICDPPLGEFLWGTWYSPTACTVMSHTFCSDGTYIYRITGWGSTTEETGTYKINENKITFVFDSVREDEQHFFETGKDNDGDYLIIEMFNEWKWRRGM